MTIEWVHMYGGPFEPCDVLWCPERATWFMIPKSYRSCDNEKHRKEIEVMAMNFFRVEPDGMTDEQIEALVSLGQDIDVKVTPFEVDGKKGVHYRDEERFNYDEAMADLMSYSFKVARS